MYFQISKYSHNIYIYIDWYCARDINCYLHGIYYRIWLWRFSVPVSISDHGNLLDLALEIFLEASVDHLCQHWIQIARPGWSQKHPSYSRGTKVASWMVASEASCHWWFTPTDPHAARLASGHWRNVSCVLLSLDWDPQEGLASFASLQHLLKKTDRPAPVQFTAFQQQVLQMVHVQPLVVLLRICNSPRAHQCWLKILKFRSPT